MVATWLPGTVVDVGLGDVLLDAAPAPLADVVGAAVVGVVASPDFAVSLTCTS